MRLVFLFTFLCTLSLMYSQEWEPVSQEMRQKEKFLYHRAPAQLWKMISFSDSLHEGSVIQLPGPDGGILNVRVKERPVFSPSLQARLPQIRTWQLSGDGISGSLATGPKGIDVVFVKKDQYYSLRREDGNLYILSGRGAVEEEAIAGQCQTPDVTSPDLSYFGGVRNGEAEMVNRYVFRLAISATSGFSGKYGGDIEGVMSRINEIFHRVNEVFLREVSVQFEIIEESIPLIFLDAETDPYTEGRNILMLNKIDELLVTRIGRKNFDVGHLLAVECEYGTAGVSAGIGTICGFDKGKALSCDLTGRLDDYVRVLTHELGHQLGASHTWSHCPQVDESQRNGSTAYEPGSGSSIMSYIGSCGSENLKYIPGPLYFHTGSIFEIRNFVENGGGKSCAVSVPVANHQPVITSVNVPSDRLIYIPIETPFFLKATAVDPDGDLLTYTWDQLDTGPVSPLGSPVQSGPSVRSLAPDTSGTRYIPSMDVLRANTKTQEEVLPSYSRDFTFGLTVRDHFPDGGGVAHERVRFKSTDQAGPFYIDYPDQRSDQLYAGSQTKIRWKVAGTNASPIHATSVTIRLSVDGGKSFPFVLAEETENNGEAIVQLPNLVSDSVRFMVQGYDHIFFDVSDENLSIIYPEVPTFGLQVLPGKQVLCLPDFAEIEVDFFPVMDFKEMISFRIKNPNPGTEIILPDSVFSAEDLFSFRIRVDEEHPADTLYFELQAFAENADTIRKEITLIVVNNNHQDLMLISPASGSMNAEIRPAFHWTASSNARYYSLEVNKSAGFEDVDMVFSETDITGTGFTAPEILEEGQIYFWRVIPHNSCASEEDSVPVRAFQTRRQECRQYRPDDLPKGLGGSRPGEIRSEVLVEEDFEISDINVLNIRGYHESVNQVKWILEKDSGQVVMYEGECGIRSLNIHISYDDESGTYTDCRLDAGVRVKPLDSLSYLKPQDSRGIWTFIWRDSVIGAGGVFDSWILELCGNREVPPLAIRVDTLYVQQGAEAVVSDFEAVSASLAELNFEVVALPHSGQLTVEGQPAFPGSKWKGADLISGKIVYRDQNLSDADSFLLSVTDAEGRWSGVITVPVKAGRLVTAGQDDESFSLKIFPNPASEEIRIWVQNLSASVERDGMISVRNYMGVMTDRFDWYRDQEFLVIQTGHWDAGVYFVTFHHRSETRTEKIIILK